MTYPEAAWERAMTVQEVMLKALSGELHWFRAAEILGWSPRTLRRWRERFETHGHSGLLDRRLLRPSKRRVHHSADCSCRATPPNSRLCKWSPMLPLRPSRRQCDGR